MAQAKQIKAPGSCRAEAIPVPAQTYRPTLAAMPELQGQRASAMVVAIEAPSLEALDNPGDRDPPLLGPFHRATLGPFVSQGPFVPAVGTEGLHPPGYPKIRKLLLPTQAIPCIPSPPLPRQLGIREYSWAHLGPLGQISPSQTRSSPQESCKCRLLGFPFVPILSLQIHLQTIDPPIAITIPNGMLRLQSICLQAQFRFQG